MNDFDKQVALFMEVMAMSDEDCERLAEKVRALGALSTAAGGDEGGQPRAVDSRPADL